MIEKIKDIKIGALFLLKKVLPENKNLKHKCKTISIFGFAKNLKCLVKMDK